MSFFHQLSEIEETVDRIERKLDSFMSTNQDALAQIKASQAAEDSAIQALLTDYQNVAAALKALQANPPPGGITAADLAPIIQDMDAKTAAIGAVVNPPPPAPAP